MTVIGILSGKGGVGKTTLVANLGVSLTRDFMQNVIIVDANINSSHLGIHLGIYEDNPVTLKDVMKGNVPVNYAVYTHPDTGVRVLPAPLNGSEINFNKLKEVIKKLEETYNIVILDTAPGLGKDVISVLPSIDNGFVVTTPDLPSLADAVKTIKLMEKFGKTASGIIVNRIMNKKYELISSEIESACNHKIVAAIADDRNVPESINEGVPIVASHQNSDAAIEIKKLAARIIGKDYKPHSIFYTFKKAIGSLRKSAYIKEELPVIVPKQNKVTKENHSETFGNIKRVSKNKLKHEVSDVDAIENRLREELKTELKKEIVKRVKEKLEDKK